MRTRIFLTLVLIAFVAIDAMSTGFLPTYTVTAWYHKKLPADVQGSLEEIMDEAREFAFGEYLLALTKLAQRSMSAHPVRDFLNDTPQLKNK